MVFKLSIITVNLNNAEGLKKTLESVKSQYVKDFQYVIIDGDSSDNSIEIINLYKDTFRSIVISEKDEGIYDAMNKGIEQASGEYIMFLNSGDTLSNSKALQLCKDHLSKFPETEILYGDMSIVENNRQSLWKHPSNLKISFFKRNNLNHQSCLTKRSLFKELGFFPLKYKLAGDHWFFLKSFITQKQFSHLQAPLINYDMTGVSFSNRIAYNKEMDIIWSELIPKYVDDLVDDYLSVEYAKQYKFIKIIMPVYLRLKSLIKG